MTDLHPVLADHPAWKRYARELERMEAHHQAVTARMREAEQAHQAALAEYRQALDAGTAPASGPPPFHPVADAGKLQARRQALRQRRSEVLAVIADDGGEDALRAREGVLLIEAADLVDQLEQVRAELADLRGSLRSIAAARGIPAAASTVPAGLDMAELVEVARSRGSVLPAVLVDAAERSPGRWTRDDPEALPDMHPGRSALRGRGRPR